MTCPSPSPTGPRHRNPLTPGLALALLLALVGLARPADAQVAPKAGEAPAAGQDPADAPPTVAEAAEAAVAEAESFRAIFDNKSLKGWNQDHAQKQFAVDDQGLLRMSKGPGWIASGKTYGDFELFVVYRVITPGAEAGLLIRSAREGTATTQKGYRIALGDRDTVGKLSGVGRNVADSLHAVDEVRKARRPAGQWNELLILANGADIGMTLNNAPVASATIEPGRGHIGLVAEGGQVEFRTIAIRHLDAPLPEPPATPAAPAPAAPRPAPRP